MTSSRPDRETEGAGVSIAVVVAGLAVVGVGLVTMHTAFRPLPKPGVPVVISHPASPVAEAAWRHAPKARAQVQDASAPEVDQVAAPAAPDQTDDARRLAPPPPSAAVEAPAAGKTAPAVLPAPMASKLTAQQVATADVPGEKLCKAPAPQLLSAAALQPSMILRYDSKFKGPPLDIEPRGSPSSDEERQIKLSQVLANILPN